MPMPSATTLQALDDVWTGFVHAHASAAQHREAIVRKTRNRRWHSWFTAVLAIVTAIVAWLAGQGEQLGQSAGFSAVAAALSKLLEPLISREGEIAMHRNAVANLGELAKRWSRLAAKIEEKMLDQRVLSDDDLQKSVDELDEQAKKANEKITLQDRYVQMAREEHEQAPSSILRAMATADRLLDEETPELEIDEDTPDWDVDGIVEVTRPRRGTTP